MTMSTYERKNKTYKGMMALRTKIKSGWKWQKYKNVKMIKREIYKECTRI